MKNIIAGLMVIVFMVMSVAAHGTPSLVLQKTDEITVQTIVSQTKAVRCLDSLIGDASDYQNACKIKPGETSECESHHCVFHILALHPADSKLIFSFTDSYMGHAVGPLEALFPESAKKPPRDFF